MTCRPGWALPAVFSTVCARGGGGDHPLDLRPDGDVLKAGPAVESMDTVVGDVMLFGGTVTFSGVAPGSFVGAGFLLPWMGIVLRIGLGLLGLGAMATVLSRRVRRLEPTG